jgi:pimeloyl-ACP methyl ester carboxylesterase
MKQLLTLLTIIFLYNTSKASAIENAFPFDVKISGQGKQAIIFIPGFACSGNVWKESASRYEKNFTCYLLTMAGFADAKPKPGASFQNWEKGIADYIRQNKIVKPILIGHSMGGALALAISADYPDLVDKIIVVDGLPCLAALMNPAFKPLEPTDCNPVITQLASLSDKQFAEMQEQTIPKMLADTAKQPLVISWSVASDRKTFAEMYCDFSNTDLREKIKTSNCSSLILLQSYFVNMKPAMEGQYQNLKNATLKYADKGLHFIMYDDQEWYFKQVDDFITAK